MNKLIYIAFLQITFLNFGCKKICDCSKSTGSITTEIRNLPPIQNIDIRNNVDLIVHYGLEYSMKVSAGSNLLDKIETRIEGNTLFIRNNNKCNWVRKFDPEMKVEIWVPEIKSIYLLDASSDILFEDSIPVTNFRLDSYSSLGNYNLKFKGEIVTLAINNGPADINATGSIGTLYLYGVGYGKLNCLDLVTTNTYSTNKGTNNFYVNCSSTLDATAEGTGNIYYKGNPINLIKKELGSGKIIQL